ncbi:hypothetical protein JHN53_37200, partial [Streptomyces sp. MBT58]|uniref:hypothetical protein n=1 Tax=Streptomyces sp. MBT58 TaxID=1488389 RepID=UPI001913EF2A
SERDGCGCYAKRDDVESGEAEHQCANGGSAYGPFSRFMREQDPAIRREYEAAMEAAAVEAENATNGYMTKRKAPQQYGKDDWYRTTGGRRPSARWASEELLEHWASEGQAPMTFREWRRGYQEQFVNPADGGW